MIWDDPFFQIHVVVKTILGLFSAYCTNFVPDEFWQSTEVAYHLRFGGGHLTWEWVQGIRSYIVPSLIYCIYDVGVYLNMICSPFLILAPQILQGALSIYSLWLYTQFSILRMGPAVGRSASMIMTVCWFTTYCFFRTITNQTELSLNIVCLYHFEKRQHRYFMVFLVLNFFIRPTSAVFWITFLPEFLARSKIKEILTCFGYGSTAFATLVKLDSLVYGRWVVTPWEFFKFNFLTSGSEEFGVHHPLWYFCSGLPSIVGPLIIFLPAGLFVSGDTRNLSLRTLVFLVVFSSVGHKEIRFLLPILPLVFLVIGSVLEEFFEYCRQKNILGSEERRSKYLRWAFNYFVFHNFVLAVAFGTFHIIGFHKVSLDFHKAVSASTIPSPEVWVLAPCYSMPINTYLHHPTAKFVHYVCPPTRYEHLYDTDDAASNLILQKNSFGDDSDLFNDIRFKAAGRGPPDFIITDLSLVNVVETALNPLYNTSYNRISTMRHGFFGEFAIDVVLLERGSYRGRKEEKRKSGLDLVARTSL